MILYYLNRILKFLFGTKTAVFYIFLFALSIAVSTFIENDFGTCSAQKVVYKAWWFELLLLLFSGSIIYNIFWFRFFQQRKWGMLFFHLAIVIIIIGSGITRFTGYEGIMHIRKSESSNTFLSSEKYFKLNIHTEANKYEIQEPFLVSSLGKNYFENEYLVENSTIKFKLLNVIPNPIENVVFSSDSNFILNIVLAGANGRENYFIRQGEIKIIGDMLFNFSDSLIVNSNSIKILRDSLFFKPLVLMTRMEMASQINDTILPEGGFLPLKIKSLHSSELGNFVFSEIKRSGKIELISSSPKINEDSEIGFNFEVSCNDKVKQVYFKSEAGFGNQDYSFQLDNLNVGLSFGSIFKNIPFEIFLNDFKMERYPGTNSASSYLSEVTLFDNRNENKFESKIFMNNILDYDGYRFFQSSFDNDELGTYLSVNHDFWGTWVSYTGYLFLTIGMIFSFFHKSSRFRFLNNKLRELSKVSAILIFVFLLVPSYIKAENLTLTNYKAISSEHADLFSKIIVQDQQGRMKPMHTLTRELLRKMYGSESFENLNADQIILSIFSDKSYWTTVPIIKIGETTKSNLHLSSKFASYSNFFSQDGHYLLEKELSRIYNVLPKNQTAHDKELIKVDERLNILGMILSGNILKIIPIEGDLHNSWVGTSKHQNDQHFEIASQFFESYLQALNHAQHSNDFSDANNLLNELKAYQLKIGFNVIPSESKLQAEIFLNNFNIFKNLAIVYSILGVIFLVLLFLNVFKPEINFTKISFTLNIILIIGFLLHTIGLTLRWYVSGRAPWSNGYESLIYIAWTTTLAGFLFSKKSFGGLTATLTLSSIVLLIAHLSYLDPEITPLVPVLKSYWLTIHVSLEAGSYGFLVLGAILGLINLVLISLINQTNINRIRNVVNELSCISELTLLGGLLMLSTGTYLGGIWANESWGRYWGWDAKETWALVSILVYAFILHMRLIPALKGIFLYNIFTLIGFSSIVMTYFGVNYYLSGLHSYAAGDPIPIPTWVYVLTGSFIFIIGIASRKRKFIT